MPYLRSYLQAFQDRLRAILSDLRHNSLSDTALLLKSRIIVLFNLYYKPNMKRLVTLSPSSHRFPAMLFTGYRSASGSAPLSCSSSDKNVLYYWLSDYSIPLRHHYTLMHNKSLYEAIRGSYSCIRLASSRLSR